MAKPLVKVVNETLVDDFGKKHLVLQPDCMYALTYDGKAVVIKTVSELDNTVKSLGNTVYAVTFDGSIEAPLLDTCERSGVKYLIGMSAKVKATGRTTVLTPEQLS